MFSPNSFLNKSELYCYLGLLVGMLCLVTLMFILLVIAFLCGPVLSYTFILRILSFLIGICKFFEFA